MDLLSHILNYLKTKPNPRELSIFMANLSGGNHYQTVAYAEEGDIVGHISFTTQATYKLIVVFNIRRGVALSYTATVIEDPIGMNFGQKIIAEFKYFDTTVVIPDRKIIH